MTTVSFTACYINKLLLLEINFLWNRIDFLKEHKLLPILLIWLHLGVWENVFPVLSKSQKIYHQMLEERHYTSEFKAKNKSPY